MFYLTIVSSGIQFGWGYMLLFYLPKILPFTFMGFYLLKKPNWLNSTLKYFSIATVAVAVSVLPLFIYSNFSGVPFTVYFQAYDWYYPALIEWAGCFILAWLISFYKTKQAFFSTLLSTQILVVGGLLYELPVENILTNTGIYYSEFFPLFIATFWFSLTFIIYLLAENKWRPTKLFFGLLAVYVGYFIFYFFHPYYNIWLPRIPTILLLSTLPLGFRRNEIGNN